MPAADLVKRFSTILADLAISEPFTVDELCKTLSNKRSRELGRALVLVPYAFPPEGNIDQVSGLWVATATRDFILFDQNADPLVRDQIIAHELGHLLAGHAAATRVDAMTDLLSGSGIEPAVIQHVFQRTGVYSQDMEAEAELIGTMLLERGGRRPTALPGTDPSAALTLGILGGPLAHHRRRSQR